MNPQKITTFLTFSGNAEEAMHFYVSVFPNTKILTLTYFEKDQPGEEGKVLNGVLSIMDEQLMFMDMAKESAVPFSWATSFLINCSSEAEFDSIFAALSEGGFVAMGPAPVMHLRKVAWVTDKFGVTWQPVWE